jgi:hypothetical protein
MSLDCLINEGYGFGCKDNAPGVKRAYIGNFTASTVYNYDSDGIITGGTSAPTFYEFLQRNETGEFFEEGVHSVENGTNSWNQTVNLVLHKNNAKMRSLLYTLAIGTLQVIVLDNNGKYWMVGEGNGADLTASNLNRGKVAGDLNGSTLTLLAKEVKPAREVSSAYFSTLTVVGA